MKTLLRVVLTGGVTAVLLTSMMAPAHAQATRTWVSGVGDDVNPCSRTAPCKTWAGAISKTAARGVINALDPGGFGAVTITKSITIDGGGHTASALVAGANGIIVNAAASDDVVLRNIDLVNVGSACTSSGVRLLNARSLRMDNVTISGFNFGVDTPVPSSSADIFVDVAFNGLDIHRSCGAGLHLVPDPGHHVRATIDRTSITDSNVALQVGPGAEAWASNSQFSLNNVGVQSLGGPIHSLCNNSVAGNASPGAFSDHANCEVPTAPPVVTPPAAPAAPVSFCRVPSLGGATLSSAQARLAAAGCALGRVTKKKAPKAKRTKVIVQNVPAGIEVRRGTAIALVIGR